jgi:hypothetical protein
MSRASFLSIALGVALVAGHAATAVGQSPGDKPAQPNLTGAWELTSDPQGAPPDAAGGPEGGRGRGGMGGRPPGGGSGMGGSGGRGGFGGGAMGGPPPGGGDRQRPSEEDMRRARDLMREMMELPRRLTITQDGAVVIFTADDGRVVRYDASGRPEKHQFTNATVETRTRWDQGALVVETSVKDGPRIVRRYTVEPEPKRLVVTTKVEGGQRQVPERQAYYEPIPTDVR